MSDQPEPTFEKLYRDLEETVRQLETGDLSLEESLTLFENASRLAEQCNILLDRAELRVRRVITGPDGALAAVPFDE